MLVEINRNGMEPAIANQVRAAHHQPNAASLSLPASWSPSWFAAPPPLTATRATTAGRRPAAAPLPLETAALPSPAVLSFPFPPLPLDFVCEFPPDFGLEAYIVDDTWHPREPDPPLLERHANSHFEDDEVQIHTELQKQIAVAESSSNTMKNSPVAVEMISSCPICSVQVLTVELERHANSHFEDDEVQMDMELAQHFTVAESSSNTICSGTIYSRNNLHGIDMEMISSCPICSVQVLTVELERHANSHFEDDEVQMDMELAQQFTVAESSSNTMDAPKHIIGSFTSGHHAQGALSSVSRCSSPYGNALDEQIFRLVQAQTRSRVQQIEGGVMTLLRGCLESEAGSSTSIISGHVDHHQSLPSEDKGWGCGWRNIQTLSSHLLNQRPEAKEVLFGGCGFVPDISSLQRWLEIAWYKHFDTVGSSHFHNGVYGSKAWIGTTECATLLRSFGLRARIVDFDSTESSGLQSKKSKGVANQLCGPMDKFLIKNSSSNPPSSEPCEEDAEGVRGQQVLVDWVWNYFASKHSDTLVNPRRVVVSDKTPLYFQHHGHSRTIVGIQKQKGYRGSQDRFTLLTLDPGHRTEYLERSLRSKRGWQRMVKRGVHTLRKPQYQLCYVDPGIASSEEMEQLKTIDTILVRF